MVGRDNRGLFVRGILALGVLKKVKRELNLYCG